MKIDQNLSKQCVPIYYAIEKCANWRKTYLNIFKDARSEDILRSFRIPIEDIKSLAAIEEAVAVRAYLSIGEVDNPATLKLLLVPIVQDATAAEGEKDILMDVGAAPDDTYIFDLTQPCPVLCDKDSALYGADAGGHKIES